MRLLFVSEKGGPIRSFYTGMGKTAVIFPSTFLVAVGTGLIGLGLIFYVHDIFSATPSQIGLLAALLSFSYITGCLFIRPLFDRILPPYTMIIATSSIFVFVLCINYVDSIYWVYLLYSLYGFSISLFWPPLMAWLSQDIEGPNLSKMMSYFSLSWSTGMIISPYLAGWLSIKDLSLPLYIGSALFIFTSFIIVGAILTLPKVRSGRKTEFTIKERGNTIDYSTPIRYPAWVGLFATYAVIGVILNIFPVYAMEGLHLEKDVVGFLLFLYALLVAIGFIMWGKTSFWHFRGTPMILGQISLGWLLIMLIFTRVTFWVGIILSLTGLFTSLSYSESFFHGASGAINRVKRMAIHEVLLSGGFITGALVGGILYQKYTMVSVYWFCVILVLVGALIQFLLLILNSRSCKV